MTLAERIPTLDKEALINLRANAFRLHNEGGARQEQAGQLIPLIDAELATRSPVKVKAAPKAKAATKRAPKRKAIEIDEDAEREDDDA